MNARDNINPKSIRLAILIALADGEITTIDDLLLKVDEPRKKVVENAAAGAHVELNLAHRLGMRVVALEALIDEVYLGAAA